MIEYELTFLAKDLPQNLTQCKSKKIIDFYIPQSAEHPRMRIRNSDGKYEITKKAFLDSNDFSTQREYNTPLTKDEFTSLTSLPNKQSQKTRYYYPCGRDTAEINVFENELAGLVTIEFEFNNKEDKDAFIAPDFCLVDITQEKFISGGMLAGKNYNDIAHHLQKFNYQIPS